MAKPADPRLSAILDQSGDAATVAWAHRGEGDLTTLPDPLLAIAAAESLGNVAALQAAGGPKPVRKAAAAALHRLRSRGVKVEEQVRPTSFTLGSAELDLPSRAFLSVPDRDGEVELLLTASDDEGNCVLAVIIGGPDLVREARHAHVSRGELRNLWREVEGRGMHTELTFAGGLHYAERLLAPRGNHDWKHFLEHVAAATLQSARILDPMAKLPPAVEDEPLTPKWMVPSGLLAVQALERYASELMDSMASPLYPDEAARSAKIDEIMKSAADAALDDPARRRLDAYLELAIAATRLRGWVNHATEIGEIRANVASGTTGSELDPVFAATRLYVADRVLRTAQEFMPQDPE